MVIALDFDDTYTLDPVAWNEFIHNMQRQGHTVYCVTMRSTDEGIIVQRALGHLVDGVFFTDRKAKKPFMFERGINVNVWIDDTPAWINTDAMPRELENQ